ncbi:MAG: glycosyltransferase [Pirellula sp.]
MRQLVAQSVPDRLEVHYLSFLTWSRRRWSRVVADRVRGWRERKLIVHHVCNEPVEYRRFRMLGLRALYANHNLMLAEKIFAPIHGITKQFDAVYNAQAWPYKRIELASAIQSLRFITATDVKWHDRIREAGCGHAVTNQSYLSREEVAIALNECHCGLALSAEEGTMLACTEYLLCGLPVVSTPSIGGRDVWLDEYNSILVEPDREAVADAVHRFVSESRDPERIRSGTLARMHRFRQALVDYVNDTIARTNAISVTDLFGDGAGMTSRFVDQKQLPELFMSCRHRRFDGAKD